MGKKILLSLLLIFVFSQIFAEDYAVRAKAARDSVWAWKMPMFENRIVPNELKNESAIILAEYHEINASGKSKLRFMSTLAINKELYYTSIVRKMVKVNDKAALERFSEFSFKEKISGYGYNSVNTMNTYLGARIIKPDGTIKNVDISEAVSVSQDKNGKNNYKKLAIPDLQIGDILDYFIQEEYKLDNSNVPQSMFTFAGRYPILNYKIHCEVNKNLTVEYKSINGAPEFKQTTENDVTNLDVEKTNIPKYEMVYWTAPLRQYPMIRMNVLNNASKAIYKPSSARSKGIYPNLDSNNIITDALNTMGDIPAYYYITGTSNTKKYIKNFKSKNPNATKEELADYIYNVAKVEWMYSLNHTPSYIFFLTLNNLFTKNDIASKIGFVTDREGARLNELMDTDDLIPIITTGNGHSYTLPNVFSYAGLTKPDIEGEVSITQPFNRTFFSSSKIQDLSRCEKILIPTTNSEQNKSKYTFEVGFNDITSPDVTLKLTQEHTGYMKLSSQSNVLNFFDTDKEFRKQLDISNDFLADYSGSKKDKEELSVIISDVQKGQKDSLKTDFRCISRYQNKRSKNIQD